MIHGGLLIDKDAGMTSHDVVGRLRRVAGQKRIGHTGTLDPIATGLMVCLFGRLTKLSPWLTGLNKEYECEARLGVETDTYDADGREVARSDDWPREAGAVEAALLAMRGEIEQAPPVFSAVKIKGKRLYKYAREGKTVEVPKRRVRINAIELLSYEPPVARFRCRVSSGAYVRSICHDAGRALGCGAHMTALRRTAVGPFNIKDAVKLSVLETSSEPASPPGPREALEARILDARGLLPHFEHLTLTPEGARRLSHGGTCAASDFVVGLSDELLGKTALALDDAGAAIALVRVEEDDATDEPPPLVARPERVLVGEE